MDRADWTHPDEHSQPYELLDQADTHEEEARAQIIDELIEGKQVGKYNARDVFDCVLNEDKRYVEVLVLLESCLALNGKSGDDRLLHSYDVAKQALQLVERFVDSEDDLISDRAQEIAEAS